MAQIYNEIEFGLKHLKRMIDTVGDLELDSRALFNSETTTPKPNPMILWPNCPMCDAETIIEDGQIGCSNCHWEPTRREIQAAVIRSDNPMLQAAREAVLMLELGTGSKAAFEVLSAALKKEGII